MTEKNRTVVFLYSELAQYTISCFKELVNKFGANLHVVRWPVNKEAPFDFADFKTINFYNRESFKTKTELLEFVKNLKPNLIITSGWMDRGYMYCVEKLKNIPCGLTMDNQWKGSLKQILAVGISKYFFLNKFDFVWVPGERQKQYALKLGFKEKQIKTGFYSADIDLFNDYFKRSISFKKQEFPKRFLFVGRYIKKKGIFELWKAFLDFNERYGNQWELWCVGTGEEYIHRIIHPSIKHFGFLQPNEMGEIIKSTGVFVLPSYFEPWGVVVQEFAASGFPIISSKEVGSIDNFLIEGVNGYSVNINEEGSLLEVFEKIGNLKEDKLLEMAINSHKIAQDITPITWSKTIFEMLMEKDKMDVWN